jgi:UDP:flavonoid glycosyltransferase YjiC (YdhE family)
MRILFTFAGGSGHAEPLLPIARAAQAAGHVVAIAGRASVAARLQTRGFTAFPDGSDPGGGPPRRTPLLKLDPEREDRDLRDGFADRLARARAAGLLALCADWRPDLIVRDEVDFGGAIAAERLGLPHATVLVIAAGSFIRPAVVAEALDAARGDFGLPPDPDLAALSRGLVLSPFPPSFRDPAFPLPPTAHSIRPTSIEPIAGDVAPAWLPPPGGAPTVYFTLGTVFNLESGDLFARVLAGLRELPITLVVTVGREIDPAEFGPQPANVHIERHIPHALILPRCDLVVSHGGSGTVVGALAHGLPSVLLPMGADQPLNAARCEALGVGRTLDAVRAAPETVRAAVAEVLADPSYRRAVERIRAEIDALPGPERAVTLLEHLATERRPLPSAAGGDATM